MDSISFLDEWTKDIDDIFGKRDDEWVYATAFFSEYFLACTIENFIKLKNASQISSLGYFEVDLNIDDKWGKLDKALKASMPSEFTDYIDAIKARKKELDVIGIERINNFTEFAEKETLAIAKKLYALLPLEAAGRFSANGISNLEKRKLEIATLVDYYSKKGEFIFSNNASICKRGETLTRPQFFDEAIDYLLSIYVKWSEDYIDKSPLNYKNIKKNVLFALRDNIANATDLREYGDLPNDRVFIATYITLASFKNKLKLEIDEELKVKTDSTQGSVKLSQAKLVNKYELPLRLFAMINFVVGLILDEKFYDSRSRQCMLSADVNVIIKAFGEDCFRHIKHNQMFSYVRVVLSVISKSEDGFAKNMCCWYLLKNNIVFQSYYWHCLLQIIMETAEGEDIINAVEEMPAVFAPSFHKLAFLENIHQARHNYVGKPKCFTCFEIVEHFKLYTESLDKLSIDGNEEEILNFIYEGDVGHFDFHILENIDNFLWNIEHLLNEDRLIFDIYGEIIEERQMAHLLKYYNVISNLSLGCKKTISLRNLVYKIKNEFGYKIVKPNLLDMLTKNHFPWSLN